MGKSKTPTPPPPPAAVDPGKSAMDYTRSMADPEFQKLLYDTEATYRPKYAALNLADLGTYHTGVLGMQRDATRQSAALERETIAAQRAADFDAFDQYGLRATDAMRSADPYSSKIAGLQQGQAEQLYSDSRGLTPEQRRIAEQQARAAGLARGRIGDQSSVAAEILGREDVLARKRAEASRAGQLSFSMNRAMSGTEPLLALLGRQSNAAQIGAQQQSFTQQLGGQPVGPRFLDPNAGINLALQNQANLGRYQTAIYGSQAQIAAANAAAKGNILGSVLGNVGKLTDLFKSTGGTPSGGGSPGGYSDGYDYNNDSGWENLETDWLNDYNRDIPAGNVKIGPITEVPPKG